MTHTPGPWKILASQIWCADYPVAEVTRGKWGDDYPSIRLVGPSLLQKAEPYMDQIEYGEVPKEIARANANLIAAAPDMLEALKEIAKMEGPYSRDPLTHAENVIENLTNIANKAIAKVEGE